MVQPAEDWLSRELAEALDRPMAWRILAQGQMRSQFVLIDGVGRKDPAQASAESQITGIPYLPEVPTMGTVYRGRKAGSGALMAAYSFNGNKVITTSGGGALPILRQRAAAAKKHIAVACAVAAASKASHPRLSHR